MDPWFWVNDWWAWVGIYFGGAIGTCRSIVSYLGYRRARDLPGRKRRDSDEIIFDYSFARDDQGPATLFGTIFWPLGLPIYWVVRYGEQKPKFNLFKGRPPRHLRKAWETQERDRYIAQLERETGLEENELSA